MTDDEIGTPANVPAEISCETSNIPRHEPTNSWGYSEDILARRKKELKEIERDYPDLPFGWLEMAWDFEYNTPQDEISDIIKSGKWEVPGQYSKTPIQAEDTADTTTE